MKKISILVSTVDSKLKNNTAFFENIDFDICEVIIIQQLINSSEPLTLNYPAKIFSYQEKGLAKSRNRALEKATCNIALIADDDVKFVKGFEQKIINAYEKYPDAALISFRIETDEGILYKNYSQVAMKHNLISAARVSSIEISLNLNLLENRKLYDENFGLGALYCPTGEDTIMCVDMYKSGKNCYFMPETIVIHPLESTGKNFHDQYASNLGKVYKRAFGWLGFLFGIFFSFNKYKQYKHQQPLSLFISRFIAGYFSKFS